MPQHTQIVKKADAIYRRVRGKRHLYQGLTSWQICSGVAHGGQIAIGNMPVFTVLKDDGKRYPKASTLSLMLYPTIENLELFTEIYQKQCECSKVKTQDNG